MASTQPAGSEPHPPFINRRRYVNAFLKVSPYTGSTFYACSENDIKALTNDDFKRFDSPVLGGLLLGGLMSMEEATVQLERFLLPSNPVPKSATNALQRLRNMLTWENHEWGPDLVVKSCYDWDKVFFNKRLKGHVTIQWRNQEAITTALNPGLNGLCVNNDVSWRWGHCRVELNADSLLLLPGTWNLQAGEQVVSAFQYLWAVVLHEYCHAYLAVLTGHNITDLEDCAAGFDGSHGKHFQRCIYAVDQRTRQLLGIGASRNYIGMNGLPINFYDVENHVVTPHTSKWAELRQQGYHRMLQACQHSLRRVVFRQQQLIKAK